MTRILVIEDEEIMLTILGHGLRSLGYDVIEAADGEAGLEAYQTEKPDMIITDMSLPKMTGWEMVQKIREDGNDVPIIALSAHSTSEDHDKAFEAGVSAYEEKPIDMARLHQKIQELTGD